jgi:hypothetical protein
LKITKDGLTVPISFDQPLISGHNLYCQISYLEFLRGLFQKGHHQDELALSVDCIQPSLMSFYNLAGYGKAHSCAATGFTLDAEKWLKDFFEVFFADGFTDVHEDYFVEFYSILNPDQQKKPIDHIGKEHRCFNWHS